MQHKRAWLVFLTRTASYLPGILVLAHSLRKVKSRYPIVCAVDPLIAESDRALLRRAGIEVRETELLIPQRPPTRICAERFYDTWTKLRVFEFDDFDRLVMLDADMMVLRNMDELFEIDLPDNGNGIVANHACVCNAPKTWAPEYWYRPFLSHSILSNILSSRRNEDCAYSSKRNLAHTHSNGKRTNTLLNSGLVVLKPSKKVYNDMVKFLNESPEVENFILPDQDFLAHWFVC